LQFSSAEKLGQPVTPKPLRPANHHVAIAVGVAEFFRHFHRGFTVPPDAGQSTEASD